MKIQEHIPLAPFTTLKVGGPARYFADAACVDDVRAAVDFARSRGVPLFVLGGGSNLVVADAGFPGLVLRIGLSGIEERREDGKAIFEAGAGEDWDTFVAHTVAQGCAGLECMSGIPGTVGGTPIQNVGAYGQEVAETIDSVRVLDLESNQIQELCNPACEFAYRSSIFNTSRRGRYVVLAVRFALEPGGAPRIAYADLKKHFAGRDGTPSLAETRQAVRQIRLSKAMLIVEGDEDCRSAGSFFKNPVVSEEQYRTLAQVAASRGLEVPRFTAANGQLKVPAAWLVEQSGFGKGYARGAVGISRRHALAVVNRGGATAAEIVALKDAIQARVEETFGIRLAPEPVFLGFEKG
ncbi:MAG TPA: UDP-N-acetylmuramate dehydrogenase [Terriglobales bacterium]|nr:UDP-N-acetylmuramate dehydrogenase [Terriglobales bacterium]